MTLVIILMVTGVILIALEIILPGGILGAFGGILLIGASIYSYLEQGPATGLLIFIISLFLGIGTIVGEFYLLPRTALGRKLFLQSTVTGKSTENQAEATVVGQTGKTLTTLAPSGQVEVNGEEYEAFSEDGLLKRGVTIRVVQQDNFRLIVRKDTA